MTATLDRPVPAAATNHNTLRPGEGRGTLVVKFGGTSLGSPARVRHAARRLELLAGVGYLPIAVVSASGHTTDRLLRRFEQVTGGCALAREQDRALATGELLSAALLAAALGARGVPAVSLGAACAGIEAEGSFGAGVPVRLATDRIRRALLAGQVPVVAGFQGVLADGELVTFGRGGSDTTAVFLAGELNAECHIITDVDGVYDRDPRIARSALRFDSLSHAALAEITESGAQVVHPEAARIAARRAIPLRIYHFAAPIRRPGGTLVDGRES